MADEPNAQITADARTTAAVQQALRSPLPRFYINSFINAVTEVDIMTMLQSNGQIVGIVNMNYTVAKMLASALSTAVSEYEKKFQTTVPDIELASVVNPKITT